jgi:spore germination protein KB
MSQTGLTTRQAILWFIMHQIGSSYLVLPSFLIELAKQDAWLSVLIAIALQLLIIFIYIGISRQMKGKTIVAHCQRLFGNIAGSIILFVFVWAVPFLIFILTLRNLGDFMSNVVLSETPANAIYLVMLIPVYFAVRSGTAVIGRAAEILFFSFFLLYVLVVISFIPSIQVQNLLPLLEYSWKPVIQSSLVILGFPYLENLLFLFLIPQYAEPNKLKKIYMTSTLISGFMFLLMVVIVISVLSVSVITHLPYASYFSVRTITIADFIERFEIIVNIFWYITIFFRLTFLLYITSQVLSELFKLQNNRTLLIPLLLIGLFAANIIWPNYAALVEMFNIWYLYAIVYGILFPFFLLMLGKLRSTPG